MSDIRLFDEDPIAGIRTWFVPLNDDGDFQLVTQQDHEPFMQEALDSRNAQESKATRKWKGEMYRVATIPLPVYWELVRKGIVDDQTEMKKWLNDPDNAVFRTKEGRV